MRAFLSLDVENQDVVSEMLKAEEELEETRADLKLVEKENLHFTVKFFGEIAESQVSEIDKRIRAIELKQIEVQVAGVGAFPDLRYPRVVWAGVAPSDSVSITAIAESVIRAVQGIGEPENHKFHPHITLARVKSGRNRQELARYIEMNAARSFGASPVKTLKLKSSILAPTGPRYTDLLVFPLK